MRKVAIKDIPPCPNCRATYPIVQAFWEKGERVVCCTHCGISARLVAVAADDVPAHEEREAERIKELNIPVRPFVEGVTGAPRQ